MPGKKKKGGRKKKGGTKELVEPDDPYMQMRGEELDLHIANLSEALGTAKQRRNML
jgi:hypothetical protein